MVARQKLPPLFLGAILVPIIVVALMTRTVAWKQASYSTYLSAAITVGVLILIQVLIYLEVCIDSRGIDVQWSPLVHKYYRWEDIEKAEVITYDPWQFGGWGLKYSFKHKAWAYSIWGDDALRLTLKSGKQVYIGIKEPAEIEEALREHRRFQANALA